MSDRDPAPAEQLIGALRCSTAELAWLRRAADAPRSLLQVDELDLTDDTWVAVEEGLRARGIVVVDDEGDAHLVASLQPLLGAAVHADQRVTLRRIDAEELRVSELLGSAGATVLHAVQLDGTHVLAVHDPADTAAWLAAALGGEEQAGDEPAAVAWEPVAREDYLAALQPEPAEPAAALPAGLALALRTATAITELTVIDRGAEASRSLTVWLADAPWGVALDDATGALLAAPLDAAQALGAALAALPPAMQPEPAQ